MDFPYSYFSCSCTETSSVNAFAEEEPGAGKEEEQEEGKTFDPRSPRNNFSLFPLDQLVWCDDCHDIKCARCTAEEIVCWYCPSCLFEVPSSSVKSEGNRCIRNCVNCPVCTAPMGVNSLEQGGTEGPWILACDYCSWTTLDIDIKFDKSTNIAAQLWKLRYGFIPKPAYSLPTAETQERSDPIRPHLHDTSFAALKSFYKSQIASTDATNPLLSPSGDVNYASPSSLARIMNLYTGTGSYAKKTSSKPANMRESMDASEGLSIMSEEAEQAAIAKLQTAGWTGTTSTTQRAEQVHPVRFQDELWPVHTLLRTRRAKRCKTCRHILVKPESKISSSRFKLKLAAISYVPSMTIKPLQGPSAPAWSLESLLPSKPLQFLLVVRNPMFDAVKVTLATPTRTPGRFASDVTILCPQFEIGANSEVWDEALSGGNGKRSAKSSKPKAEPGEPEGKVAEAGKVWQKERNSTTVVVEVVCARIVAKDGELEEDEDVLEIPVFVRLEYETDVPGSPMTVGKYDKGIREVKDRRERRELAYWCVLGVGRIAKSTV